MWVKLNGQSSSTINGLVITSIPPITAPPRRYNQILIDGRDGDIIEDLGAAPYDKQFTILLHNSFDPDEVLSFFSSSGDVIFSNEPDKRYLYTMIGNINIAKGNYNSVKVATVTLHCQPYKYDAEETPISQTITSQTSISVTNSGNVTAKPSIVVTGSGQVTFRMNGDTVLRVTLTSGTPITIDAEALEATKADGTSANRLVTGNIEEMALRPGSNTISWTGTLNSISISKYSRWI